MSHNATAGTEITPDEVRGAVRDLFADRPGGAEARRMLEAGPASAGIDAEAWSILGAQLGIATLCAPEAWGGMGLGLTHLVAAAEEWGAALYAGPARAAAVLSVALGAVDPASVPAGPRARIEAALAAESVPGLSLLDVPGHEPEHADGALSGRIAAVTHGGQAELVLCVARTANGPALVLADVAGVGERSAVAGADATQALADIAVDRVPALVLTDGTEALERHRDLVRLLVAAEQVGGAVGCLSAMVDYAKIREQFGQLIGGYQAIQHRCARLAIDAAATRALVGAAAAASDAGDAVAARRLGLLARAEAGDLFHSASDGHIQVSGGIGFTWEHDAHLYFRRARALASLGGTSERHRHAAVEAGCLDLLLAPAS